MKNLFIIVCIAFLSVSVMAQSDTNTKTNTKTNNEEVVEFFVKKVNKANFISMKMSTIEPATKIIKTEVKPRAKKAIDEGKQKSNSKAVKED